MKKIVLFFTVFYTLIIHSQTDFSDRWEDFFSYNNVQDFVKVNEVIYALVDNAVFIYNTQDKTTEKISSVHGLSGETATAIHYNTNNNRLVIGYENGLLEVVDSNRNIITSPEITNFNQAGEKRINDIFEYNNKLYLATSFAIVVYDIEHLEFGDTYFIGANSSDEIINQVSVLNDTIYATTPNGIYTANITNPNLIDYNNWSLQFSGNFQEIEPFNNRVYVSSEGNLHEITGASISQVRNFGKPIVGLKASENSLSVSTLTRAVILNASLTDVTQVDTTTDFNFKLNDAFEEDNTIYLATKEFGILETSVASVQNFTEIHPEGPLSNDVFSIDVYNRNLWVVNGGFTPTFAPAGVRVGYSHFNGENWQNTRYTNGFKARDLVAVTIDRNAENRVFISSFGGSSSSNLESGGLLEITNNEFTAFYNQQNSPLENLLSTGFSVRVGATAFDRQGNLWISNVGSEEVLKKLTSNSQWKSFNLKSLETVDNKLGVYDMAIDKASTVWMAMRQNGVYVFNENGNKKRALTSEVNRGNLPNGTVKSVAIDANNRVWIGTITGLVVFNNASGVFEAETINAQPVIIEEEGAARRLLGDQSVNAIFIDGANNKWFGTETGGAIFTNPSGQTTLATFNTDNSPLPSNKINKIKVDASNGKVYFATEKGLVAYNSNVSPFGDELAEVYAYPNPALKNHSTVTISGRNGTNLPRGTTIKILDVSGNLVYETNVIEGQELQGGKAVWNKKNLAGQAVASGVYIVLLSNEDATETATTKIAIVN